MGEAWGWPRAPVESRAAVRVGIHPTNADRLSTECRRCLNLLPRVRAAVNKSSYSSPKAVISESVSLAPRASGCAGELVGIDERADSAGRAEPGEVLPKSVGQIHHRALQPDSANR